MLRILMSNSSGVIGMAAKEKNGVDGLGEPQAQDQ
jgi:hypothetical protein